MKHINKFNESSSERFFFSQDCSSHWYMIPLNLKDEWDRLNTDDEDDYETIDEFNTIFSGHRISDISSMSFESPIRINR